MCQRLRSANSLCGRVFTAKGFASFTKAAASASERLLAGLHLLVRRRVSNSLPCLTRLLMIWRESCHCHHREQVMIVDLPLCLLPRMSWRASCRCPHLRQQAQFAAPSLALSILTPRKRTDTAYFCQVQRARFLPSTARAPTYSVPHQAWGASSPRLWQGFFFTMSKSPARLLVSDSRFLPISQLHHLSCIY
jgi:hypothetical protein